MVEVTRDQSKTGKSPNESDGSRMIDAVPLYLRSRLQNEFLDGRSHRAHLLKRNPRKVTWTVLYRRKHNKGIEADVSKKRTKRTQKFQRAVVGATLQDIMAKRNQKPEVRKAQREQAIR